VITDILKMVLPVIIAILLGLFCSRRNVFGTEGLSALKSIIGRITLPVVLFNAFFTASYSLRVVLMFTIVFCSCTVALALGYLLRPLVKSHGTFMPFLLSGFETGMLGYALFGLIAGSRGVSTLAMFDVGQTLFAYTVFLAMLQSTGGKKPDAKGLIGNMLKNPAADGMLLGIILGVSGIGKLVLSSAFAGIYTSVSGFIAAPTAFIILIVIGYELSLKKELLRPVFITAGARLLISGLLFLLASAILFALVPFEKNTMLALMVLFSLPAPFIIPLFADVKKEGEYISASLSVSTVFTIILFVIIAIYSKV